ncbi:MAG TPA: hypothetical protein VGA17_05750 [Nitrospiraceae bacterium]
MSAVDVAAAGDHDVDAQVAHPIQEGAGVAVLDPLGVWPIPNPVPGQQNGGGSFRHRAGGSPFGPPPYGRQA